MKRRKKNRFAMFYKIQNDHVNDCAYEVPFSITEYDKYSFRFPKNNTTVEHFSK